MTKLEEARAYMLENQKKVKDRYRQTYHAVSPVGWMNDPNGFCYALQEYHLFFQYNPYDIIWGPMHWGHYTSKDFVKWSLQPVALAPDESFDWEYGCFSGSMLVQDKKFYIFYTGVANGLQTQCLAVSEDGVEFHKETARPVISTEQIPEGHSSSDFRDPKVVRAEGAFYCFLGSKNQQNLPHIALYRSEDLYHWNYVGLVVQGKKPSQGIYECPDFFQLQNCDVLMMSPQFLQRQDTKFENIHSVVYSVGTMDFQTGRFTGGVFDEVDSGFDFYATQTLTAPDGRVIMTAWMQMWDRNMPTAPDGYVGAMILPRELSVQDGQLIQQPVREIMAYRKDGVHYQDQLVDGQLILPGIEGKTVELDLELDMQAASVAGVKLFCENGQETLLYYDKVSGCVIFDRSRSGIEIQSSTVEELDASVRHCRISLENNRLQMRIFLDRSSIEAFLFGGRRVMTGTVYPDPQNQGIVFFSDAPALLRYVHKYRIEVQ